MRAEIDAGRGRAATISIRRLALPRSLAGRALALAAPVLDPLLGLRGVDAIYRRGGLRGLSPFEFARRSLAALGVTARASGVALAGRVPASGPLLIVCNHPFGAVEALVIADALATARPDLRFLANTALQVIPELAPLLIPTNPLRVTQNNLVSIRRCEAHLRAGGALVIFPAGRVSFRQRDSGRIADGAWNRIVGHLALRTRATLLPVFFEGANSRLFHILGNWWDRAKLLLLAREMLRLRGREIRYRAGRPLADPLWRHLNAEQLTHFARVMVYAEQDTRPAARTAPARRLAPLAQPADATAMAREIRSLPDQQRLLDFRQFSVLYAHGRQMPAVMFEITRERERVFRALAEGSGDARDGDRYDDTYVQLFAWDNRERALVGAYRLGRTDRLRAQYGAPGVYLSQMFDFDEAFFAAAPPSLELGRSFVVPEHQKSFHGLYLLWQGIGRYLCAHPRYRRLYGTVSLSRQYDDRAVGILCDALIDATPQVRPRHALAGQPHPEWSAYRRAHGKPDLATLSAVVRGLDREGKDLPILLKHYYKLGARFHCVAVDPNFSDTPGLLLSVDIPALGPAALKTFLGAGAEDYVRWRPSIGLDPAASSGAREDLAAAVRA